MPGYGAFAYGELPYGGGEEPQTADGFSISDSVARSHPSQRTAADSWSVSDAAGGIYGFDPPAFDSWTISESASQSRGLHRSASDSWTVSDHVRAVHIPYVDQPTFLVLKPDGGAMFVERNGDSMSLDPALATLQLKSDAASNTLNAEDHELTLEDDAGGVWLDG